MIRQSHLIGMFAAGLIAVTGAATARAGITHRYSFNEPATGGAARDAAGNVDAKLKGAAAVADGKLVLKNENKASDDAALSYLELAAPVLPKSGSASLVVWFSATEAGAYSRVLDIGDKEGGEGQAFIYLSPRTADDLSRAAITATDAASKTAMDNERLDDGKPHMVAIVIDGTAKKLHTFIDGKEPKPAEDLGANTLDKVRGVHGWIGRSSFDQDPGLSGSIDELRIYDHALTGEEATTAFKAGPDTVPASGATTQPAAAPPAAAAK